MPIAGGRGTKGVSGVSYAPEDQSQRTFTRSGATYDLQIVPGADHNLGDIDAAIERAEGRSIQEKVTAYFGLDH